MVLDIGSHHDETPNLKEPVEGKRSHRIPVDACSMGATAKHSGHSRSFGILRVPFDRLKRLLINRKDKDSKPSPTGKLGEVIRCLEASEAAALHDLMTLTGWKRATVHGALSRLRARGYKIRREIQNGTPVYRLERR